MQNQGSQLRSQPSIWTWYEGCPTKWWQRSYISWSPQFYGIYFLDFWFYIHNTTSLINHCNTMYTNSEIYLFHTYTFLDDVHNHSTLEKKKQQQRCQMKIFSFTTLHKITFAFNCSVYKPKYGNTSFRRGCV